MLSYLVVDITKCFAGYEIGAIQRVHQRHPAVPHSQVQIVCSSEQSALLRDGYLPRIFGGDRFNSEDVAEFVWTLLAQLLASSDVHIVVSSFHGQVYLLDRRLTEQQKALVTFESFTPKTSTPQERVTTWPKFIPLEQALNALSDTLRIANVSKERPRRKSDLPILARTNAALDPVTASHTPGLLGMLVSEAAKRNIVTVDVRDNDRANPYIWLNDQFLNTKPTQRKIADPGSRTRTGNFLHVLREKNCGPFSRVREIIFDSLEGAATRGGLVPDVITSALSDAKRHSDVPSDYPWRHVRIFIERLLMETGVLLGEADVILTPSLASLSASVKGLVPDWRLKLNAQVIFQLAVAGANIAYHDIPVLAEVLFGKKSAQHEVAVRAALQELLRSGRALVDANGCLAPVYRDATSPSVSRKDIAEVDAEGGLTPS